LRLPLFAGVATAAIGLAGSVVGTPAAAGPAGEIAYVRRTVSGGGDIYATTLDGRRTRRITRSYRRERDIAASPDGAWIAFTMRDPGTTGGFANSSLWIVATAGGRPSRLTHGGSDTDPAWADDGRTLLFSRVRTRAHDDPADEIASVSVASASIETLVPAEFGHEDGTCEEDLAPWPARGLTVFIHVTSCLRDWGGNSAMAVDPRGRVTAVLPWLERVDFVFDPAVSPDDRRIAYYAEFADGREADVFVALIDGSHRVRLNASGAPSWSPDGRRLAVVRKGDIWIVRRDGSAGRRLTTARGMEESPVWVRLGE
jgi:dipeptidyl aminopeptidase/acylaminoacyl peptidase